MKSLTHRQFGALGLGIIVLVNALALGGAAWNRSAVDSRLALGERELQAPYYYGADREDSGTALTLVWRVSPRLQRGLTAAGDYSFDATPAWLDAPTLATLGFATTPPADTAARVPRPRDRAAWAVLELDGPAYRGHVLAAERYVARARAKLAGAPNGEAEKSALKYALERQAEARDKDSRLFVVAAGRDRDALRRSHPDRRHYAIVEAIVSAGWTLDAGHHWRLQGNLDRLRIGQVQLSRGQAEALGAAARPQPAYTTETSRAPFFAVLAFGRRAEPWIETLGPR